MNMNTGRRCSICGADRVTAPCEHPANEIDPRLVEIAQTDEIVHAALQAHVHGLSLHEALTAAVIQLARWRKAWSPEAMRAMMLRPPPPIMICCSGKHGDTAAALTTEAP